VEGRIVGEFTKGRRKIQMLDDLYVINSYEVLKRTTEDRSTWRKAIERKCQKPAVQQTTEEGMPASGLEDRVG